MSGVKASVLIPVYNGAPFIKEAVESILNQSFTDFELILLNDASPDNSEEIIKTFKDARIRYYRNEKNLGISASRNKLMTLARGEYLIVMDDDDISLPNRLEEQIKFMDSHPDVTMAGSWCELFSRKPDKGIINYLKYCFYNLGWIWTQKNSPGWEEMFCCNPIMHTTSVLRRQHIEQHQIRYNSDYSPAEDYDLCRQILSAGLKLANIPQLLVKYRWFGSNVSITRRPAMKIADHKVKADVRNILQTTRPPYPYYKVILRKLRMKILLRKY